MPPRRKTQPRSPEHAALGAAIEQMRKEAGISQEALADASNVHLTQIGGMERGLRNPSYTTLLRVALALDSGVGALTTLADEIREGRGDGRKLEHGGRAQVADDASPGDSASDGQRLASRV